MTKFDYEIDDFMSYCESKVISKYHFEKQYSNINV